MELIAVKASHTWAVSNGVNVGRLQPFAETLGDRPAESERLLEENHSVYF